MEQQTNYKKQGQLTGTASGVVMLVIGVGVATLVLIFVGSLSGQVYEQTQANVDLIAQTATDDTITVLNSTAVSLTHDDVVTGSITVENLSNTVANSKFTFDLDAGTVTLLDNAFNNVDLNFTYAYGNADIENSIKNTAIQAFAGLEQSGNYIPIIVLAVIISLVLGLIFGLGVMNKGSGGGSAL